jgi:hypothetical protein
MLNNESDEPYVILIRHASRELRWDMSEEKHRMEKWKPHGTTAAIEGKSDFKTKGFPRTYALAGRLCDELENREACVVALWHSEHDVAHQTAEVYEKVFNKRGRIVGRRQCCSDLTPKPSSQGAEVEQTKNICTCLRKLKTRPVIRRRRLYNKQKVVDSGADDSDSRQTRDAYVLIGHQPQLTQIARSLLRRELPFGNSLPFNSLPLGSSEAACIKFGNKPRLLWVLTEKPEALLKDLKDKIESKYDVAKFFLGAFAVNTGLLLNAGIWSRPEEWRGAPNAQLLAYAAIVFALVSLIFTAFTLFSYDSLRMPHSLWAEPSEQRKDSVPPKWSVSRPPSQAQIILYYEMMHIWSAFFMPAVISAFVAIGCLVFALVCRDANWLPPNPVLPFPLWGISAALEIIVLSLLLLLSLLLFYWWKKPRLGTED